MQRAPPRRSATRAETAAEREEVAEIAAQLEVAGVHANPCRRNWLPAPGARRDAGAARCGATITAFGLPRFLYGLMMGRHNRHFLIPAKSITRQRCRPLGNRTGNGSAGARRAACGSRAGPVMMRVNCYPQ